MGPSDKPIYAEEVMWSAGIKVSLEKDDKGNEKIIKHGHIEFTFFDSKTNQVVARVIISPITAKAIADKLGKDVNNLLKELEKKEIPKELKEKLKKQQKQPKPITKPNYFG